tara:strand:- start:631 stop:1263 length:633 start_codon:yes stop_codon:yes gene_type:complete
MGATASIHKGKIVAPEGYDENKFKLVRVIFDKLDQSGDMVLPKEALTCLGIHYVNHRQWILQNDLNSNATLLQQNIQQLLTHKNNTVKELIEKRDAEIKALKDKYKTEIEELETDYQAEVSDRNEKIQHKCDTINEELTELRKTKTTKDCHPYIVGALQEDDSCSSDEITFDKFFNFIKNNKLDDRIENLQTMTQLAVQYEREEMDKLLA